MIVSHGTGGNRFGYASLGRYLAARGYVVIHPTHAGSDDAAMKSAPGRRVDRIRALMANSRVWRSRAADVAAIIDAASTHPLLRERVDVSRVGVVGHSYGAHTAMTVGGMRVASPGCPAMTLRDARVGAVVALSPPSIGRLGIEDGAWDDFTVPLLVMTGTLDSELDIGDYTRRRMAFDRARGAACYVLISGADHLTFADYAPVGNRMTQPDPLHVHWIHRSCGQFLDAFLRGAAAAQEWMRQRRLTEESGGSCSVEYRAAR